MGLSLVAFDTDHIKRYVFGTDRLKEIRGASSLLDHLNRVIMQQVAKNYDGTEMVYAHGGSGLFLVPDEHVGAFQAEVRQSYDVLTGGGASITAASWPVPDAAITEGGKNNLAEIGKKDLGDELELLQWRLQEEKLHPPSVLALPSHPFLRLCDACGIEYAEPEKVQEDSKKVRKVPRAPDEGNQQYCASCQKKRIRDSDVQDFLSEIEAGKDLFELEPLWHGIIRGLRDLKYDLSARPERPTDFNVFRNFKGAKDYLALIYADANNMGRAISNCPNLLARKKLAEAIDKAIYTSVCTAIARHLKVNDHLKPREQLEGDFTQAVFPFDILLLGGDDVCLVVPASVALDVALTLAETFRQETDLPLFHEVTEQPPSLSVAVVLAPIKYPFGLLQETAETALKFAKKDGADARTQARKAGQTVDDTRINFLVVTGSNSSDFKAIYNTMYHKEDETAHREFHATLRPYAPADLHALLKAIRAPAGLSLGRTKLHQVREAVLQMNLTTSVSDGLAMLSNWRPKQREHVVRQVYEFAGRHQMPRSNPDDPASGFPA